MNNIDLTPFKELQKRLDTTESLDKIVWALCQEEEDFYIESYENMDTDEQMQFAKSILAEFGFCYVDSSWQCDYHHCVFRLKDKMYKAIYESTSYGEEDYWDITSSLCLVKPVEKTIIVYEEVK